MPGTTGRKTAGSSWIEGLKQESRISRFVAEWDDQGVFFYQAFNKEIAQWAVEHQRFGGPQFNPERMTWIKPSFAWVLYRSGYGHKDQNQTNILKVKLPHAALAHILSRCECGHGGGGKEGRIQWDPGRCLEKGSGGEPARHGKRAIQIGMKGKLSHYYVEHAISIEDVTPLAHKVGEAHASKSDVSSLRKTLPLERAYTPHLEPGVLDRLHMLGDTLACRDVACRRTSDHVCYICQTGCD
jgi:hypothetical protein